MRILVSISKQKFNHVLRNLPMIFSIMKLSSMSSVTAGSVKPLSDDKLSQRLTTSST